MPGQSPSSTPSLEQDVTAWQAIEKARYTLDTLIMMRGLDQVSANAVNGALDCLKVAKDRINARRSQRIEASAKAGK